MLKRYERIWSPALNRDVQVLCYGHYGPAWIAFPSGGGQFHDFEDNGMIDAAAPWLESGRLKLYCPESVDGESWLNAGADHGHRGWVHRLYEDFLLNNLVAAIRVDCGDSALRLGLVGCSLGAYHAVNFTLKHPEAFHLALGLSGRYDLAAIAGPGSHEDHYFNNPCAYVYHLHDEALGRVQRATHVVLVCGQGAWEENCLAETRRLAELLRSRGISHHVDIWGHDVEHHWYWWRRQLVHHLGRFFGT